MGIQIVLAGLLPLTVLGRLLGLPKSPTAATALAFSAASLPLLRRAWQCDRGLLGWVVPLSYLRASAQGIGLALGLASVMTASTRGPSRKS